MAKDSKALSKSAIADHLAKSTGNTKRVATQFLDDLTYGSQSTPGLPQEQADWREKTAASRSQLSRSEQKRQEIRR